jgi:DNA-binding transcriptional ArsR family regulator
VGLGDVFRALGDPTRRRILAILREGDRTAGELALHFPLAKSTLSGHFAVLKQADLVVTERQGTRIVYSFNASSLDEALGALAALLDGRSGKRAKDAGREETGTPPAGVRRRARKKRRVRAR